MCVHSGCQIKRQVREFCHHWNGCRAIEFALAVYIRHTNYEDIVLKSPQKHTNCCERHSET